jgi:hypothetical protein
VTDVNNSAPDAKITPSDENGSRKVILDEQSIKTNEVKDKSSGIFNGS